MPVLLRSVPVRVPEDHPRAAVLGVQGCEGAKAEVPVWKQSLHDGRSMEPVRTNPKQEAMKTYH